MILGIQIIGTIFAVFMMYMSFIQLKRKELTGREYILWTTLWVGLVIVTLVPDILSPITRTLNLNRKMDLLIITGFLIILGILYSNYRQLQEVRKKMEKLVRKTALK